MIIITKEPNSFQESVDVRLPPENNLITRTLHRIQNRVEPEDFSRCESFPGRINTTSGFLISENEPFSPGSKYSLFEDRDNDTRYLGVLIIGVDDKGEYEFTVDAIDSIDNPRVSAFGNHDTSIPMQIQKVS